MKNNENEIGLCIPSNINTTAVGLFLFGSNNPKNMIFENKTD